MVKNGKLASDSSNSNHEKVTVQAVGIDAANKLLGSIGDVIGKTINKILEKVKTEINQVRAQKAIVQK